MSDNNKTLNPWGSLLPDDIVTNIFLRLPIKSIIICTSVSKKWKSLILDPKFNFISTHLHHSYNNNNNHNLHLFSLDSQKTEDNKEIYVLYNEDDTDFTRHASFDIPLHGPDLDPLNKILHVVGTCNGLLCLSDYSLKTDRIFLWNPCVGKYLRLPSPNVTYATHGVFKGSLGFGFDPETNDYKVVRVVSFPITPNLPTLQHKVEVYSLSTGQWRMLSDSLVPTCVVYGILTQSSVNGAMHWLVSRTANDNQFDHFGLVFDLHNEVFREILLPELPAYMRQRSTLCASVSTYRNSIALFHDDHNSLCLDIWVMKDYGVVSSWMKALSLPLRKNIMRAVGFCRNGHIVLELDGGQLISWDLETQEIKDFGIIGYNFVDAYVESLVLLDKTTDNTITY